MPWKTLCGFPPSTDTITLLIPNGRWRPDTVITDADGNEYFVLIDQAQEMRSYEAVFGDLEGRRLCCVKRHLTKAFWRDGYYFCTYRPNYPGQKALTDRDCENKKVYPFSYLEVQPMKGRLLYRHFGADQKLRPPRMIAQNPWLGFMNVCCTPLMRTGNFTANFHKARSRQTLIHVDQWKNCVEVGPGNDLLAALCMAYVFDRMKCQPMVTVIGKDEDDVYEASDASIASDDDLNKGEVEMENMPSSKYKDQPNTSQERKNDDPNGYSEPNNYEENGATVDHLDDHAPPEQAPPLNKSNQQSAKTFDEDHFVPSPAPTEIV